MVEDVLEQVTALRQFITAFMPGENRDDPVWLSVDEFTVLQDMEERLQDCEEALLAYLAPLKQKELGHEGPDL